MARLRRPTKACCISPDGIESTMERIPHETANSTADDSNIVGNIDQLSRILAHVHDLALGKRLDLLLSITAAVGCRPSVNAGP